VRAVLTLGLLAEGAVGGFMAPASPVYVPPRGPTTVTVVPNVNGPVAPTIMSLAGIYHPASGGEYLPNAAWQAKADADGQADAEHLASRVVELASRRAGYEHLTPEFKRHFIQIVMAGIGGLDPDEAADVIEVAADDAGDMRLGPLTEQIGESFWPGPRDVRKPPDGPAPGGPNLFATEDRDVPGGDFAAHAARLLGLPDPGLPDPADEERSASSAFGVPLGPFFDRTLVGETWLAPAAPAAATDPAQAEPAAPEPAATEPAAPGDPAPADPAGD